MFGDILAWFYKALAGIQPEPQHPGFSHFIVKPYPAAELNGAQASYRSIRGDIRSSWRSAAQSFALAVQIPVSATARVCIPAQAPESVQEGGKPLSANPHIRSVELKNGYVEMEVESGSYRFVAAK
jgi:alpha-L-rhamnosidase